LKIAVVGCGVAGSYLLNRLSNEHEVFGFERQKEGEFQAVCLVPQTPIITNRGVIPICEVKPGDFVLTHRGRFREVVRVFFRQYSGTLTKITPKYTNFSIRLTPEHPILVAKAYKQPHRYDWIPAGDIFDPNLTRLCVPGISKCQRTKPVVHPRLIGYYLGGGYSSPDGTRFCFANEGEECFLDDTVSLIKGEGFKCHVEHRETSRAVVTYSAKLATVLRQFGTNAHDKRLPMDYINLSDFSVIELLRGLFGGGGFRSKEGMGLTTSSITLAVQVHLLLRRLGMFTSVKLERDAASEISTINGPSVQTFHASFRVDANGRFNEPLQFLAEEKIPSYPWSCEEWIAQTNNFHIPIQKCEHEEYTGPVYNLEVEVDNSYQTIFGCLHNCAWGTSKWELQRIMRPLGIDFERYILFDGKEMLVDLGDSERRIKLIGLCTYDKHQLEVDLAKNHNVKYGSWVTPASLRREDFDIVIDATGVHRTFLPKLNEDIWVPCIEYKIRYQNPPYTDFYIKPFKGISGYFWYFPLEENNGYVGAGDVLRRHNEYVNNFNSKNGGEILKKLGRPIRITPPNYCEPFFVGNTVGVGESIGTVFPLLGEGIIPSLQCAEIFCDNIDDWQSYRKEVLKKFEFFDHVYELIKLKLAGKFSMLRHTPLMMKTYASMKRQEKRFGLEVNISDMKAIISSL
jgi:hypothetical protein